MVRMFLECFLGFLIVYWLFTIVLLRWPVGSPAHNEANKEVTVYINSNGVHTDIVVPICNEQMDWAKELGLEEELLKDSALTRLAFGWGNKRFFLNTKDWSDLTFTTAFGAAFHLGTSAMHLIQTGIPDTALQNVITLELSKKQYGRLTDFLKDSFSKNGNSYIQVKEHPYGPRDFFFESTRSYGLAYTCNSWTNDALKASGQPACKWTAMRDGIYLQYGRK
jgi:uncharacterized protein (TIGR02117 family)